MADRTPDHRVPVGWTEAAIWINKNESGHTWFNVKLTKSYMVGDAWKHTELLGFKDLLDGAKALDKAFDWIWEFEQAAKAQKAAAKSKNGAA